MADLSKRARTTAASTDTLAFMSPARLGPLHLKNRLVRAPTSETMATSDGMATDALVEFYSNLAAGGAGLLITGHIYVEPGGQYEPWQLGLHDDSCIEPLQRVTRAVHDHGGVIFAELSHAGSQSIIPNVLPVAPSIIPNTIHDRAPREMTEADIVNIINSFGAAAGRASAAGFDGIHIHSGNGYLLSQFNSPRTNRRADQWGGNAQGRSRFITQVLRAIRDAIGPKLPITARFGVSDAIDGGLTIAESVDRAVLLAGLGLLAIEPTYNIMSSYKQNIRPYAGNSLKHALSDGFLQQLFVRPTPEAYYRSFARTIKQATDLSVFLVGGLRSTSVMDDVIRSGDADFISLARPFIREPDLPRQIERGRRGRVDCVSCNLCFKHEGLDPVQCWRVPKTRLLSHLKKFYFRKC